MLSNIDILYSSKSSGGLTDHDRKRAYRISGVAGRNSGRSWGRYLGRVSGCPNRWQYHRVTPANPFYAFELAQQPIEMLVADPEFADLVSLVSQTPAELAPAQWERLIYYYFMMFNAWKSWYLLNNSGSVSLEL